MKESTIHSLDPAEILCSGPWLLYPATPVEKIIPSIGRNGQLAPVLLVEKDGKIQLVAGRARVEAARKLGKKVSAVFVDAPDDISCAIAHIDENFARTADESVKCASFRFFAERMDKKDIPALLGPVFSIRPKSRDMEFWMGWLDLETEFDPLLAAGNIPLAAVAVLGSISAADRAAARPFFEQISWSRSNAVNFLTWLYETARRDSTPVAELLGGSDFSLSMGNESPKDAVARLCRAAKLLRYPNLSRLEKAHSAIASEICAGTRWKVEPVGSFETGEVLLQTRFKSREMLEKALADLKTIAGYEGWETVFDLGRDKQDGES
ncbi:ParB N-terminal domain-containing protein [Maridesulfovibrio sp. FT414]|uniref:ParB N-terminal domain-containing protein n=1 Tax=Maridesulfovibrio sp. FT414 TaxID=2979469 RepID=UPI003D80836D